MQQTHQSSQPNPGFGSGLGWVLNQYRQINQYLDILQQQAGAHQQIIQMSKSKNNELIQSLAAYKARYFSRCR